MRVKTLAFAMLAIFGGAGLAAETPTRETARVVEVIDGDTLVIDRDLGSGHQVRLQGAQAPKPFPDGSEAWIVPHAEAARVALSDLATGRTVTLLLPPQPINRYGQVLAQVERDDGMWLQGEMLRRGLIRVHTQPNDPSRAAEMLRLEDLARRDNLGLWAEINYAVRTPENVGSDLGTFQIVEGRIVRTARVKSQVYLNFGEDWRKDFTVNVPLRQFTRMHRDGLDLLALEGKRVRVRGWINERNGPEIELTHPEQLEVIESPSAQSRLTPPAAAAVPVPAPPLP